MTATLTELLARYRDIVIEGEGEEDDSLTVEERDRSYRDWVEREAAAYGAIETLFASLEAEKEALRKVALTEPEAKHVMLPVHFAEGNCPTCASLYSKIRRLAEGR